MRILEVETGMVKTAGSDAVLKASALGSCIAVVAYDRMRRTAGLAHIMLPGAPLRRERNRNRYAVPAIRSLLLGLRRRGCHKAHLTICLAGAGNVLELKDDTICEDNIRSVSETIRRSGLSVAASSLGGYERRSVWIEPGSGVIRYTVGDGAGAILWQSLPTHGDFHDERNG